MLMKFGNNRWQMGGLAKLDGFVLSSCPIEKRGNIRILEARNPYVVCKARAWGSPLLIASSQI